MARYWLTDNNRKKIHDAARKRAIKAEKEIEKEAKIDQNNVKSKGKAVSGKSTQTALKHKCEGQARQESKRQRVTESPPLSINQGSLISTQDGEDDDNTTFYEWSDQQEVPSQNWEDEDDDGSYEWSDEQDMYVVKDSKLLRGMYKVTFEYLLSLEGVA